MVSSGVELAALQFVLHATDQMNFQRPATLRESRAIWLLATLGIVAALYFAKTVFMPVAVAVLLTFVLAPPFRVLRGWGLPRAVAAPIVVALAFIFMLAIASILGQQLTQLAERLPQYEFTITQKIQKLRDSMLSGGTFERMSRFLGKVNQQILGTQSNRPTASISDQPKPAPVEIVQPPPRPTEVIRRLAEPLLDPLTTFGLIVLFVLFFLLERETLRDRMIRLAGSHDLGRTTEAINDAARRLSRYFLLQTGLNALFGTLVAVGLTVIGVPNPILWGILGILLRFVPYVGAWIAAALPIAVSFAVDPGWSMTLWTAALFLMIEPIIGQVLEPLVYGRSTGVTPVAVIVSATFWTWLWGPVGLLLSTPLAVCLGVLGRHIESLQFLGIMIGDEPPLTPAQSFYQRTLSVSTNEAIDEIEQCLKQGKDLIACYQDIVLEALLLASIDRRRGVLDNGNVEQINEVVRSMLAEFAEYEQPSSPKPQPIEVSGQAERERTPAALPLCRDGRPVLCISGPGPFDHTAAQILAQVLERIGIRVRLESDAGISPLNVTQLTTADVQVVCLSYLYLGHSPAHLRYSIRRLRRRMPSTMIVACLFGYEERSVPKVEVTGANEHAMTLSDVVALCSQAVKSERAAICDDLKAKEIA
jgi:predicted PurR-regulated permease PerM